MSAQSEITRIKNAVTDAKAALVEQGITVPENANVESIGPLIRTIICPDVSKVTAAAGNVLAGKVFVDANGNAVTGTMTNRGAVSTTVEAGGTYTIPAGYHNGSGKVTSAASSGYQVVVGSVTSTSSSRTISVTHGLGVAPVYAVLVLGSASGTISNGLIQAAVYKMASTSGVWAGKYGSNAAQAGVGGTVTTNATTVSFNCAAVPSGYQSLYYSANKTYNYIIVG